MDEAKHTDDAVTVLTRLLDLAPATAPQLFAYLRQVATAGDTHKWLGAQDDGLFVGNKWDGVAFVVCPSDLVDAAVSRTNSITLRTDKLGLVTLALAHSVVTVQTVGESTTPATPVDPTWLMHLLLLVLQDVPSEIVGTKLLCVRSDVSVYHVASVLPGAMNSLEAFGLARVCTDTQISAGTLASYLKDQRAFAASVLTHERLVYCTESGVELLIAADNQRQLVITAMDGVTVTQARWRAGVAVSPPMPTTDASMCDLARAHAEQCASIPDFGLRYRLGVAVDTGVASGYAASVVAGGASGGAGGCAHDALCAMEDADDFATSVLADVQAAQRALYGTLGAYPSSKEVFTQLYNCVHDVAVPPLANGYVYAVPFSPTHVHLFSFPPAATYAVRGATDDNLHQFVALPQTAGMRIVFSSANDDGVWTLINGGTCGPAMQPRLASMLEWVLQPEKRPSTHFLEIETAVQLRGELWVATTDQCLLTCIRRALVSQRTRSAMLAREADALTAVDFIYWLTTDKAVVSEERQQIMALFAAYRALPE